MADPAAEPVIGIDLGTTFSLVAYVDERGPQVLRDANQEGRLPSVIGVVPRGPDQPPEVSIGWTARNHAVENPSTTVYSIKRLIGKSLAEIESELPFLSYAVKAGPRDTLVVDIEGRDFTPEEISSVILRSLKERAEQAFARPVRKAVITVPAYFDDAQRQATRDAGEAAGLEVLRIINEPTAAALAYGIGLREQGATGVPAAKEDTPAKQPGHTPLPQPKCSEDPLDSPMAEEKAQTVAVYDLGGGTFDISVLRLEAGIFQVLSTAGDTHLGGDDLDRTIIQLVTGEVQEQFGVAIDSPVTQQALRGLAEAVKIRLATESTAEISLDLGDGRTYQRTITQEELETLVTPLVKRTLDLTDSALKDAGLSRDDLDQLILVGGSTRAPIVRRQVANFFGRPPYTALDPDEVVALGAAIQGAMLTGKKWDMLLLDVTPLSLGIETMGGAVGKLIMRNATIPCRATEMFTTFVDNQTGIKLNILQGERELAADCRSLGEFELKGLPPMPAGMPKVEVEFLLDANGILKVSATEQRSGQAASIQVVPSRGLTREEVQRITTESVQFAKEDIDAHRRIDLVNQVAFDTAKTEQMLAQVGDALEPETRTAIEQDMQALRAMAKHPDDLDALHQALDQFGKRTLPLAEKGIAKALAEAETEK